MAFWNKNKKENTESQKMSDEQKVTQEINKKTVRNLGMINMLLILVLTWIIMGTIPKNNFTQVLIGLSFGSVALAFVMWKLINQTVGFKFLTTIMKAKKLKNKGYGIVKEFRLAGKPAYHLQKFDDIIRYDTKINGEKKKGFALYNPYAKYEDFGASIPIVEATYNDISLKNVFTGNRIGMNPDLADKIIVESGISPKELDDVKKHRKLLLMLLGGIAVAGILSFDLFAQRLAEANQQAISCYKELGKEAVITSESILLGALAKIKKNQEVEEL